MNIPSAKTILTVMAMAILASCENPVIESGDGDETGDEATNGKVTLSLNITGFEQTAFDNNTTTTSAKAVSLSAMCSRLNVAIYKDNERVASVNQEAADAGFGSMAITLDKGLYSIVAVAHNCDGNATMTDPSAIKFPNNKVTDTFYCYDDIAVSDNTSASLVLRRAVAMFRLVVTGNTPSDVENMEFYYTGGSSTFDAVSGYGCVNSRQTETRTVSDEAYSSQSQYDVYTFPHSDGRDLTMRVTALDANETSVTQRTFENVPVERNKVTRYTGSFFGESPDTGRSITFTISDEWSYDDYTY